MGNNWDGTADVINVQNFTRIKRLNIIPDKQERLAEILADPVRQGFFLGIRQLVGEGHDQYVDDMFSSNDGTEIYVSRPSFADVIALNVATGKIRWRTKIDGQRADHMAISKDGKRVLVSASTARNINVIDTSNGQIVEPHRVRRPAAREQLLGRRHQDLPREHRHRLHAARTRRALTPPRATATSRSSTPGPTGSSSASRWARRWPRRATRASAPPCARWRCRPTRRRSTSSSPSSTASSSTTSSVTRSCGSRACPTSRTARRGRPTCSTPPTTACR